MDCLARLPEEVREQARRAYCLRRANPAHSGLRFKPIRGHAGQLGADRLRAAGAEANARGHGHLVLDRFARGLRPSGRLSLFSKRRTASVLSAALAPPTT